MKLFIKGFVKGKGLPEWQLQLETDNKDKIFIVARYYINRGYDVKIEQNGGNK